MPQATRDPERALENRLERDRLLAEVIREQAILLELPVIDVDGTRALDEVVDAVEAELGLGG